MTEILRRIGVEDVTIVPEQENPDGHFPTCPLPEPGVPGGPAKRAGAVARRVQPDLLVATDPDCDRVGIAVRDAGSGEYRLLSGNEVGVLLLDFIAKNRLAQGTMPRDPVTIKTIVSTDLADLVAQEYGVQMIGVLTGFKYIGDQIALLEAKGAARPVYFRL